MATFKKLLVTTVSPNFRAATELVEVSLDPPEPGKVLIKNKYVGTNATDVNVTAARYFTDGKVPFDIGFESLGTVEQIGSDVKGFQVGQPIMFLGSAAYAEYTYALPEQLIPVPDVDPKYIAIAICGLTACIGLDTAGQIKRGDKVLITAAAGGTGHICVQWAKSRGCYVIGTTSSKEKAEFLTSIGCDHVINYKEEDLGQALTRDFPDGIDVIWETIGGKTFELLFEHLAVGGRMVIIGGISGYTTSDGWPKTCIQPGTMVMKSLTLVGFILNQASDKFQEYFGKLIPAVAKGEIKIRLDLGDKTDGGQFKGVADIARAVEHLHAGKNEGKVVTTIY